MGRIRTLVNEVDNKDKLIFNPLEGHTSDVNISPEEFKNIAYKIFQDSPEEFFVFDEMMKGGKPRHIASALGITENDVHNIKRRIFRVLQKWFLLNKNKKLVPIQSRPYKSNNNNMEVPKCA